MAESTFGAGSKDSGGTVKIRQLFLSVEKPLEIV
jgi:hypothetical protein